MGHAGGGGYHNRFSTMYKVQLCTGDHCREAVPIRGVNEMGFKGPVELECDVIS